MPNHNIKKLTKEEFDNKTQLSQKKLQRYQVGLVALTKYLPPMTPTTAHLLPQVKVQDHHRYQPHDTKCKGEFIVKD